MPEDEVPEFARQAVEFQQFQQKQYEKALREKEENYNADLSAFVTFIDELSKPQLDYVRQLIEDIGGNAYSQQLIGIIVGSRVYRRGLMVDGKTYEEALGLDNGVEPPAGLKDKVMDDFDSAVNDAIKLTHHPTVTSGVPPTEAEEKNRQRQAIMDRWGLVSSVAGEPGPVSCKACGRPYASAEDAEETFIKNDGCPGCHLKAKWG